MKISLATISDVNNFGTHLQIYALSRVLSEMGHEVELVNYVRDHRNASSLLKGLVKSGKIFSIRSLYYLILDVAIKKRMDKFSSKHLSYSKKYVTLDELKKNPPKADIYLTGSDQVWNSIHNKGIDKIFYLDYAPQHSKCISYAASFGMDRIPADQIDITTKLLKKYSSIGVRENSALQIIQRLGFVNGEHVLDPTFLLTKDQWTDIASSKTPKGPYLLIYTVEPGYDDLLRISKIIAKEKGLRICMFTPGFSKQLKNDADDVFFFTTPDDFISLFVGASFVVVSSFHGTAFSINLNKQFILISPKQFNSRTDSILKLVGLESRCYLATNFDINGALIPIDYIPVNKVLNRERDLSISFLSKAIG